MDLKIDKKNSEVESSQVPEVQLLNLVCFLIIEPQNRFLITFIDTQLSLIQLKLI